MRLTIFAAAITFLVWGTPAFAQDFDADGVADAFDNCSEDANTNQIDSDGDDCGNVCDADYDGDGVTGFLDIFEFGTKFGSGNPKFCHLVPILPCAVGFNDLGFLLQKFSRAPGPSGTTPGTTACP